MRAHCVQTIHLVCVLKGGSAFFQDVMRCLRNYHEQNDEDYGEQSFNVMPLCMHEVA
jgi:hypoxanthine-guanine phosphoribosyltransferase